MLIIRRIDCINPLDAELNPICHLLAVLGAHHILHVSRIRVNTASGIVTLLTCALTSHLQRVTIPDGALVQSVLLMMSI
jgi:hypothetical protein